MCWRLPRMHMANSFSLCSCRCDADICLLFCNTPLLCTLTFAQLAFLYANGPLAWAIPCWRNSLVFHDIEKTSSVYIHLFPGLLTYSTRWHNYDAAVAAKCEAAGGIDVKAFGLALAVYIVWQAVYFVKTEVVDKPILLADPALQTSLRSVICLPSHLPDALIL